MIHKVRDTSSNPEPTLEWWLEEDGDGEVSLIASNGKEMAAVARITPDGRLRRIPSLPDGLGLKTTTRGGIVVYGAE